MRRYLANAVAVALLPPIWACLASSLGLTTGAVALICAGLVQIPNERPLYLVIGLWMGILWGNLVSRFLALLPASQQLIGQFGALFCLGFLVVIGHQLWQGFSIVGWLTGWAITLQILSGLPQTNWLRTSFEIGIAMLAGIYYIGFGVPYVTKRLTKH